MISIVTLFVTLHKVVISVRCAIVPYQRVTLYNVEHTFYFLIWYILFLCLYNLYIKSHVCSAVKWNVLLLLFQRIQSRSDLSSSTKMKLHEVFFINVYALKALKFLGQQYMFQVILLCLLWDWISLWKYVKWKKKTYYGTIAEFHIEWLPCEGLTLKFIL